MKTVLRSLFFISLMAFSVKKSNAQCTVSNIIVQNIVPIGSTATTCTVRFDATFNIADNSGNKFIFLHAWLESAYPNYFRCVNGQSTINGSIAAPGDADLVNSFINIGLNNIPTTPIVLTTYPNGSTPMTTVTTAVAIMPMVVTTTFHCQPGVLSWRKCLQTPAWAILKAKKTPMAYKGIKACVDPCA